MINDWNNETEAMDFDMQTETRSFDFTCYSKKLILWPLLDEQSEGIKTMVHGRPNSLGPIIGESEVCNHGKKYVKK